MSIYSPWKFILSTYIQNALLLVYWPPHGIAIDHSSIGLKRLTIQLVFNEACLCVLVRLLHHNTSEVCTVTLKKQNKCQHLLPIGASMVNPNSLLHHCEGNAFRGVCLSTGRMGFLPRGSLSRASVLGGVSVQGVSVQGVFVQGVFCQGYPPL